MYKVANRGMIGNETYSNVNFCKSCCFHDIIFPKVRLEEA